MNARRPLSDGELGERLVELGGRVAWPTVPDLSPRVTAAIKMKPAQHGALARLRHLADAWSGGRRAARRSLLIAIAVLLAIAAVATAIGLGVPGIRIELRPIATESPSAAPPAGSASGSAIGASPSPAETQPSLDLGPAVTLDEARRAAAFGILVPAVPGSAGPDEVHLLGSAPLARVSLVYGDRALVTEFLGAAEPDGFQKIVGGGTTVEPVMVGRTTGYWITGAPHELGVLYRTADGTTNWEVIQVSGNVLIWQAGPVTLRLQTTLDRDSAVQIAGSAR
jgi:hypothetical protein